jgi:hypothetical protein
MAMPRRGDARLQPGPPAKTIPFDYVFQFALQGTRGNKVQDVVEISSEGIFVALSVGYSLMLDEQRTERTFQPVIDQRTILHSPVFVPLFESTPNGEGSQTETFVGLLLTGVPGTEMAIVNLGETPRIERTINIEAAGTVTVPLTLDPQIIHLLRVWDKTHNLLSEVFEVNVPPTPVTGPDPTNKKLPTAGDIAVHVYGPPGETVDLFLMAKENGAGNVPQVGSVRLVEDTTSFGSRTGREKVTLAKPLVPGDVLMAVVRNDNAGSLPLSMFAIPRPNLSTLTLGALAAGLEQSGADLTRGFRLNPDAVTLATAELPLDQLSNGTLGRIFETGSVAAEEVSFLYSFDVGDTGREYQNRPIHNIAGLGIANGDRPMRPFAKPMVFEPRSFIRLQVEEISGLAGTLFIVLQGYKILGTGRIPG